MDKAESRQTNSGSGQFFHVFRDPVRISVRHWELMKFLDLQRGLHDQSPSQIGYLPASSVGDREVKQYLKGLARGKTRISRHNIEHFDRLTRERAFPGPKLSPGREHDEGSHDRRPCSGDGDPHEVLRAAQENSHSP